jgi:hypothetical protein
MICETFLLVMLYIKLFISRRTFDECTVKNGRLERTNSPNISNLLQAYLILAHNIKINR